MPTKPKSNKRGQLIEGVDMRDLCMTPDYAIDLIVPHLRPGQVVWEPCAGEGHIVNYLRALGFTVIASEYRTRGVVETPYTGCDFLTWQPERWDVIITNFPFSRKYEMIRRALTLGKPWASLVPLDTIAAGGCTEPFLEVYERTGKGMEVLFPKGGARISYKMPSQGWNGSGAQFYSIWLGWSMGMPAFPMDALVPMTPRPQGQTALDLAA